MAARSRTHDDLHRRDHLLAKQGQDVQHRPWPGAERQIDGATGELLHRYSTVHEPGGVLPVACKTRRASRCPPCAEVYSADTYQLIRAAEAAAADIFAQAMSNPIGPPPARHADSGTQPHGH